MNRERDPRDPRDMHNAPERRQRETIMDRRLRKARGEEVDDALDDPFDDDADYDYGPRPRARHRDDPIYTAPYRTGLSIHWSFYVFLAGAAILGIIFLFGSAIRDALNPFDNLTPEIPAIASPTPTIRRNSAAVLEQIRSLQRLETTSYTLEKVIEAGIEGNAFEDLLFGDRLLLIAHGDVIAGFDLSKLEEQDITISEDGSTIIFHLPPPEIFSATLDNEQTRVYDREQGLLAPTNKDLETQARQAAEEEILKAACEGGIMERANTDGKRAIEQFLHILAFDHVEVVTAAEPPCPPANVGTPPTPPTP